MISSRINYKGKVTIKVKDNLPRTRHNEGTTHLFDLLHSILTQTLVLNDLEALSKKLPAYFMFVKDDPTIEVDTLLHGNYSDIKQQSVLLQALPIVNRELINGGIRFSSLLTHSMLNTSKYEPISGYILLLDSSLDKILAFSRVELTEIQPVVDISGQASIDWIMSFDNSVEESKVNE